NIDRVANDLASSARFLRELRDLGGEETNHRGQRGAGRKSTEAGIYGGEVNRRTFVGTATAAALMSRLAWSADEHRIEKIGLELYTVRDLLKKDFASTIAKVAKIGYKEVELAGYLNDLPHVNPPVNRAKEILDASGLAAPSCHISYNMLSAENWPKV